MKQFTRLRSYQISMNQRHQKITMLIIEIHLKGRSP